MSDTSTTTLIYGDSEAQTRSKLVMYLCNYNEEGDLPQVSVFIGWDSVKNDYFLRGRKFDTNHSSNVPFAFHCDDTNDLYDFLVLIMGRGGMKEATIYNFNNIFYLKDEEYVWNFEFFEGYIDPNYEIVNNQFTTLHREPMVKYLRLLKYMYNWDNNHKY